MGSSEADVLEMQKYNSMAKRFLALDETARRERKKGNPFNSDDIMSVEERSEFIGKTRANEQAIREYEFRKSIGFSDYEDESIVVEYKPCPRMDQCNGTGFCHYWRYSFLCRDERDQRMKRFITYYECDKPCWKV